MIKTSVFRAVILALFPLFLTACGGGEDATDNRVIPADAKVCELKEVPYNTLFTPRYDIRLLGPVVPGDGLSYLLQPNVKVSEDLVFTVGLSFPATPPERKDRRYSFTMQEWKYHTGEASRYGCIVDGLQPLDQVVISGGKTGSTRLFFVDVTALTTLDDGRIAATSSTQLLVEY